MAVEIKVGIDDAKLKQQLAAFPNQIKFATARALTKVALQAAKDVRAAMEEAFDRPTPFTLNAFYAKPAKKSDLTSWIGSREQASNGIPASKYLAPQIEGGSRPFKGFERALANLSGGQWVMPARGAQLDRFGNMNRAQLVQILSRLGVMRDPSKNVSARTTAMLRRRGLITAASGGVGEYFIAYSKQGNRRPLGVWKLVGRGIVTPVLVFTSTKPSYRVRLPFEKIVNTSIADNWEKLMQEAITEAISTARL
jgi:hypothetical protein